MTTKGSTMTANPPTPRVWTLVLATLRRHRSDASSNVEHLRSVVASYLDDLDLSNLTGGERTLIAEHHNRRQIESRRDLSSAEILLSEYVDSIAYFEEAERLTLDTPDDDEIELSELPANWRRLGTNTLYGIVTDAEISYALSAYTTEELETLNAYSLAFDAQIVAELRRRDTLADLLARYFDKNLR